MSVLQVARIVPQNLAAVRVSMAESGNVALLLASLMVCGYEAESLTGPQYAGGWRIKFHRGDDPDQFAYQGDWILVSDATFTAPEDASTENPVGWHMSESSRVFVYGVSTGLLGDAPEFVRTFTAECATRWDATSTPPVIEDVSGVNLKLVFLEPTSANGPFTYAVTRTDVTENVVEVVSHDDLSGSRPSGTVCLGVSAVEGHECTFHVTVESPYESVEACVSAETESITV